MNTDKSTSGSRDHDNPDGPSLTVSFADQFDPDEIYAGRAEHVPITLANHTDTIVSERVTLGVFYGQELLSGLFTVPPTETRQYTALWEPSDSQQRTRNQLYLNAESDSATVQLTIQTPVDLHALNAVPDSATVGEEVPLRFTLDTSGESLGAAQTDVTVSHHRASESEGPSQAPPSQSTLHDTTHTLERSPDGPQSVDVTLTFTPTEAGHHVFTFENEQSETTVSLSVSE